MSLIQETIRLNKPLLILIIGIFLVNLGSFLVIPYMAIYVTDHLGLSILFASYYLTINLLCQRVLAVIGGILSDRLGAKSITMSGLFFRSTAYLLLAFCHDRIMLIISAILMGLGSALYTPASKALMLKLCPEKNRSLLLSLRSVAMNSGVALGPLAGLLVFRYHPAYVFLICVAFYIIVLCAIGWFVPKQKHDQVNRQVYFSNLKSLSQGNIKKLSLVMVVFMMGYMQIELTVPLFIKSVVGDSGVGIFFTLNAILCISLSLPLVNYMTRFSGDFNIFFGFCLAGLAFIICAINTSTAALLTAGILFSLAEIIFFPNFDLKLYSNIARSVSGVAFGISDLAASIGGLLGITLGGYLFNILRNYSPTASGYWGGLGLVLLSFALIYYIGNQTSRTSR